MSLIILDTVSILEERRKYDKVLSKITFGSFTPIYVYQSMIRPEKNNLTNLLKGIDYLFSNLMNEEYNINIYVKDTKEKTEIEIFLKNTKNKIKVEVIK